jgi:hypothetical protein
MEVFQMTKLAAVFSGFIVLIIYVTSLHAQPTGDSLIQAWENVQKKDPKVVVFEKLEDKHYKFKTDYFPYDGELLVKGVIMDDVGTRQETDYIFGKVHVELVGLPTNFLQQYSYNYSVWSRNNALFYNNKTHKWVSSKEFQNAMADRVTRMRGSPWGLDDLLMIVALILCSIAVFYVLRKNRKYMETAFQKQDEGLARYETAIQLSEKGVQLTEETNKLLKEILDILKSKN